MSDEQTIYISPEDDLTTVRERLEKITTRSVTLVIPSQTQLRSHVAWKLLYARARELGKDVLIVSSDPQVRSVAHAVKFKVAHSLESPQTGKSRPISRPSRTIGTSKGKSPTRTGPTRSPVEAREASPSARLRQPEQDQAWYRPEQAADRPVEEVMSGGGNYESIASPYETDRQFGQTYDFHVSTSPPIRPLPAEQIEEPDLLLEDYTQAQGIREAASGSLKKVEVPKTPGSTPQKAEKQKEEKKEEAKPTGNPVPPFPPFRRQPDVTADPFSALADPQAPPRIEQRGGASIEGFDTNEHSIQDVSDISTSIIDNAIEFRGDKDVFTPNKRPVSKNLQGEPIAEDQEDEGGPAIRHVRNVRPRSGRKAANPAPLPPPNLELDDDALPPVEIDEYPTRLKPPEVHSIPTQKPAARPGGPKRSGSLAPPAPRMSGKLLPPEQKISGQLVPPSQSRSGPLVPPLRPGPMAASSQKRSGQLVPPAQSRISGQPTPRVRQTAPMDPSLAQPSQRPSATSRRPNTNKKRRGAPDRSRTILPLVAGIVLFVLVLGTLAFIGPSSTIQVVIASRDYAHDLNLQASTRPQPDTLPATLESKDFTKDATEPATGTKQVDKAIAKGRVCISNNSDKPVHLPSGLLVATANGVQFQTGEDTVMHPNYKCSLNDPYELSVQATKAGEAGNVPAGSITVITDDSLNLIAQSQSYQTTTKGLQLTITNTHDVTGGGVQPVPAVTTKDLDKAKLDLHKQLQGDIDAWVKQVSATGIVGQPATTDTLTNAPKDGEIQESGNFPATIMVHTTLLLVNKNDVQKAAATRLNQAIHNDKSYLNYAIIEDPKTPVTIDQLKISNADSTAMTLKFNARSKAIPDITKEYIQHLVAGKSKADATSSIMGISPDVQRVTVKTNPDFISWVAYWQPHIEVSIQPGPTPSKQK